MAELISIVFLIVGLVLVLNLKSILSKGHSVEYCKYLTVINFFLLWNSEYQSTIILTSVILIINKKDKQAINQLLKDFVYVLVFTFIFRKIKDVSIQAWIQNNLNKY